MTNSAGALGPATGLSGREGSHRAPWRWRLEDADGRELDLPGAAQRFPSQGDAESWVGEEWQDLLEQGVDAVTLLEEERVVYGPMSLHAES